MKECAIIVYYSTVVDQLDYSILYYIIIIIIAHAHYRCACVLHVAMPAAIVHGLGLLGCHLAHVAVISPLTCFAVHVLVYTCTTCTCMYMYNMI